MSEEYYKPLGIVEIVCIFIGVILYDITHITLKSLIKCALLIAIAWMISEATAYYIIGVFYE